jgi:hypothetical protein
LSCRDLELKILDEFYSSSIFLIISQRFAIFLRLFLKLRVSLTRRHIVYLHPVDLSYFVHQQSIITNMLI